MKVRVVKTSWQSGWVDAGWYCRFGIEIYEAVLQIKEASIRQTAPMLYHRKNTWRVKRSQKIESPDFEDMGEIPWRFLPIRRKQVLPFRKKTINLRYEATNLLQINCRLKPGMESAQFTETKMEEWNEAKTKFRVIVDIDAWIKPENYEFQLVRVRDINQ